MKGTHMTNQITLMGNLASAPEMRKFPSEAHLTTFRLVSSRSRLGQDGKWENYDKLFIDVECWGNLALNVRTSLVKGRPVVCTGYLITKEWKQDGKIQGQKIVLKATSVALDLNRYIAASKKSTDSSVEVGDLKAPDGQAVVDFDYSAPEGSGTSTDSSSAAQRHASAGSTRNEGDDAVDPGALESSPAKELVGAGVASSSSGGGGGAALDGEGEPPF